jgi:8-oxo-dGTP diphosphatase
MKERFKSIIVVFLVLTRTRANKKEILLQKRQNTGYMDGKYDVGCSGHLEPNESVIEALIRETEEELGIIINKKDIELATIVHDVAANYVRFFFCVDKFEGVPTNKEPKKCSEIMWAPIDDLPEETIPHIRSTIKNIEKGIRCDDGKFAC